MRTKTFLGMIALAVTAACSSPASSSTSFSSCAEAKKAGFESMKKGDDGYSKRLDADGDGIACDQK